MEMIIVLTIIALLMGLAIVNLTGFKETAERQKVQADILTFKDSLALYELNSHCLPTTEQGLKALWSRPTAEPIPQNWHAYAKEETKDPWDHSYQYRYPAKHSSDEYDIFSLGPDGLPDTEDDLGNWKQAPTSATNP